MVSSRKKHRENDPISARKGSNCALDRACQKALKGMRQKIRRKIATVRTTGTPRAQAGLRRETSSNAGGSGTPGSDIGSSVQSGDGLVESFLHWSQRKGESGSYFGRISQVFVKQDIEYRAVPPQRRDK